MRSPPVPGGRRTGQPPQRLCRGPRQRRGILRLRGLCHLRGDDRTDFLPLRQRLRQPAPVGHRVRRRLRHPPLGAILIGAYADRAGRKPAMLLTLFLMALGTGGIAVLPGYDSIGPAAPLLLVLTRLLQGLAWGGEAGPATTYILEAAPPQARHLRLLAGRGARHRGGRRRADGLPAHPLARRAPTAGMGLADSLRGRPAGPADRPVHPPQPGRDLFRTRPPGQHPEPARRVVRQSSAGPAARPADPLRKHHHPVLPQLHDHLRPYRATPAGGHRDALDAGRRRRTGALGVARRRALRPLRAPRRADPAAPGAARGAVPGTAGNDPSPRAGSLPRRPRPALGPAWHERRGADRAAGRKLPRALRSTGFPWSMRPASPRSAAPRRSW